MRLPIRTKNKKSIIIICCVATLAIIGAGAFYYIKHRPGATSGVRGVNDVQYTAATEQERNESNAIKQRYADTTQASSQGVDSANQAANLALSIVRAGQINQTVQIRSYLSGATSATCTFVLSQDGQASITKTAASVQDATTSSCNADIPIAEVPTSGNWRVEITAQNQNSKSSPVTASIEVAKS